MLPIMGKLAVILLFLSPHIVKAEMIELREGVNQIDLDGDGVKDSIIKTDRFNGTAHSYISYSFALMKNERPENVSFEGGYVVKEVPGADCAESVIRFEKKGSGFFLTRISLRPPDFDKGEYWWAPREAYKRRYELVGREWQKIDERFIEGYNCDLGKLF